MTYHVHNTKILFMIVNCCGALIVNQCMVCVCSGCYVVMMVVDMFCVCGFVLICYHE